MVIMSDLGQIVSLRGAPQACPCVMEAGEAISYFCDEVAALPSVARIDSELNVIVR